MRILFVTPTLPLPISGGRTRLFNLIKQLAVRHQVSIVSFIQPSEYRLLSNLRPYCQHMELVPFEGWGPVGKWRSRLRGWSHILFSRRPRYVHAFPVTKMRTSLRELLGAHAFDVVVFEQLYLAELLDEIKDVPVILAEQNVESDIVRKQHALATNPVHRLRDWLTWRKLLAFEQCWVQRFPICVAVSERDAGLLRKMSPSTHLHIVPNGVDSQFFADGNGRRDPGTLLFFGSLRYGPNVDGLVWFCQQVLPIVRESKPNVKLEVVGLDPVPRVRALGQLPGVRITGFVPDIRPKLWSATMCIVPLLVGGGTRLKILEALAARCPVISTTIGAEGLSLMDGEHLIIADTPREFARGIVSLLDSDDLRYRLARMGRQAVVRQYDWRHIAPSLESACMAAVEQYGHNSDVR